jgi:hypothetical protein
MNIALMEKYEKETGEKAIYRKESSDYHTLRYVTWLENNNVDLKVLLKRCLPTISYMADVSDEVAKLLVDIQEAIK